MSGAEGAAGRDLVPVHGGLAAPVDRRVRLKERAGFLAAAARLPGVRVTRADLSTVYRLADGALSPLEGPMGSEAWHQAHGQRAPLAYADANAILFDVIEARRADPSLASSPEVELAIVRILESLRLGKAVSWQEAAALLRERRLDDYLAGYDG